MKLTYDGDDRLTVTCPPHWKPIINVLVAGPILGVIMVTVEGAPRAFIVCAYVAFCAYCLLSLVENCGHSFSFERQAEGLVLTRRKLGFERKSHIPWSAFRGIVVDPHVRWLSLKYNAYDEVRLAHFSEMNFYYAEHAVQALSDVAAEIGAFLSPPAAARAE